MLKNLYVFLILLLYLYNSYGTLPYISPELLQAIAIVESNENPQAINPQDPSYGLMQIQVTGQSRYLPAFDMTVTPEELMDPEYNVMVGAKILNWNIKTYGYPRGIAVYNSWSARRYPEEGPFPNQRYVDAVLKELNQQKE